MKPSDDEKINRLRIRLARTLASAAATSLRHNGASLTLKQQALLAEWIGIAASRAVSQDRAFWRRRRQTK
jgi:hypothetical protein